MRPVPTYSVALFIALLALAARSVLGHSQAWYPDEGAFTEIALGYWRDGVPGVGALKQSAFLPQPCGLLAPWLAAPWAGLASSPLFGTRLWSALLNAGVAFALVRLGQRFARPWVGIGAGTAMALWPMAVNLGAWAFYHHAGALFVTLSACSAAFFIERSSVGRWLLLCAFVGLSLASAYWTLWLGFLPWALVWRRIPGRWWALGAVLIGSPLIFCVAWGNSIAPGSLRIDLVNLFQQTQAELPVWVKRLHLLYSMSMVTITFPPVAVAVLGLGIVFISDLKQRALSPLGAAALVLVLGGLEPLRQRSNLGGFSYPLILLLPALCFGLGVCIESLALARLRGQKRWMLGSLVFALLFVKIPHFRTMNQVCAPVGSGQDLLKKAAAELRTGDLVIGQDSVDWGFPEGVRVCQWDDLAASEGKAALYLPATLPASHFRYRPKLTDARWLVISRYSFGSTFQEPSCLLLGLEAERLGFTQTWANADFAIYTRPMSPTKAPGRLLTFENLYRRAAEEAQKIGDRDLAQFAIRQTQPKTGAAPGF